MTGLRFTRPPPPWVSCCHCCALITSHSSAALSRAGAEIEMFAPDVSQAHVVDHSKGAEMDEQRR